MLRRPGAGSFFHRKGCHGRAPGDSSRLSRVAPGRFVAYEGRRSGPHLSLRSLADRWNGRGGLERHPLRGLALTAVAWFVAAFGAAGQQPSSPRAGDEPLPAAIAPLVAKAGTNDASAALLRLTRLVLETDDVALASAGVGALPRFGEEGERALERVVREAATLAARSKALALVVAHQRPNARSLLLEIASVEAPLTLRLQALDALANDAAALPDLEALLTAREQKVLARALRLLGRAHRPAAVDRAKEILSGDARAVPLLKIAAVEVLRDEGGPESIKILLGTASHELGEVRAFAMNSLAVMDRGAVLLLLLPMVTPTAPPEDALTAIELLRRCRLPATDEALRRALDHKDLDVQAAACLALGELGDETSLARLEKATLSPEGTVASAAIEAVTRLRPNDPDWREKLKRMTRSQKADVRLAATDALGLIEDASLAPLLVGLLDDHDWRVRETAAEALGRLRPREAVGPLIDHLERDRYRVRDAIAIALRRTTGMPFDESRSAWRRWWTDHAKDFEVPPVAQVDAMEAKRASARVGNTTRASFYGIPVTSDHVTVVIDVSGSMGEPAQLNDPATTGDPAAAAAGPTKLDVAKTECTHLLEQMPDGAHLNLLFFSDQVERWQRGVVELDRPHVVRATMYVRDRRAGGSTNLCEALTEALADPETDAIYLLTDGEPTSGKIIDPALLRADVHHKNHGRRVQIHTIALGHSSALLQHISEDSHGVYTER